MQGVLRMKPAFPRNDRGRGIYILAMTGGKELSGKVGLGWGRVVGGIGEGRPQPLRYEEEHGLLERGYL